jgi:hypothetical protein
MPATMFGFPLILGSTLRHFGSALEWAIRNSQPWPASSPSSTGNPAISGNDIAPRLEKVGLGAGRAGEVVLTADFTLNGGTLTVEGQPVTGYSVRAHVTVKASKTELHFDPAGSDTRLIANGREHAISRALAVEFGLDGTARVDLAKLQLGRWQLLPLSPAIRTEGSNVFVGMDIRPTNATPPFAFRVSEKPEIDLSAFRGLPANVVSPGWGYLIDSRLAAVVVREIEIRMTARPDMREFTAEITTFDGPSRIKVKGAGTYIVTGRGILDGPKGFTFEADVTIAIVNGRVQVAWAVTDARHGAISVMPYLPPPTRTGRLDSNLPMTLGDPNADFGQLTVNALSGGPNVLYCIGSVNYLPVAAPLAETTPEDTVYIQTGKATTLEISNLAASSGKRRAPLHVYSSRLDPSDPAFTPTLKSAQVAPSGRTTCSIGYGGSGTRKGTLLTVTNDKVLATNLFGWEVEGTFAMPRRLEFKHVFHPLYYTSPSKQVPVTNTGNGPLFLHFAVTPANAMFSIYVSDGQMTLDPGETETLEAYFNPGISAPGTVALGRLTTTTQSGLAVHTDLIGRVVKTYVGVGIRWTKALATRSVRLRRPVISLDDHRRRLVVRDHTGEPAAGVEVDVGGQVYLTLPGGLLELEQPLGEDAVVRVKGAVVT